MFCDKKIRLPPQKGKIFKFGPDCIVPCKEGRKNSHKLRRNFNMINNNCKEDDENNNNNNKCNNINYILSFIFYLGAWHSFYVHSIQNSVRQRASLRCFFLLRAVLNTGPCSRGKVRLRKAFCEFTLPPVHLSVPQLHWFALWPVVTSCLDVVTHTKLRVSTTYLTIYSPQGTHNFAEVLVAFASFNSLFHWSQQFFGLLRIALFCDPLHTLKKFFQLIAPPWKKQKM